MRWEASTIPEMRETFPHASGRALRKRSFLGYRSYRYRCIISDSGRQPCLTYYLCQVTYFIGLLPT